MNIGKPNINLKDCIGLPPFSRAAMNVREAMVKLLADTGNADIDSKDNYGWIPLSLAAMNGHEAVVRLLVETGKANIDPKDNSGLLSGSGLGRGSARRTRRIRLRGLSQRQLFLSELLGSGPSLGLEDW